MPGYGQSLTGSYKPLFPVRRQRLYLGKKIVLRAVCEPRLLVDDLPILKDHGLGQTREMQGLLQVAIDIRAYIETPPFVHIGRRPHSVQKTTLIYTDGHQLKGSKLLPPVVLFIDSIQLIDAGIGVRRPEADKDHGYFPGKSAIGDQRAFKRFQ